MGPDLMSPDTEASPAPTQGLLTPELGTRAVLLLVAVLLIAFNAPTWLATPMVVLAAAAVVQRVARGRGQGGIDAWVAGLGGLLVTLVLLGLALNLLPGGLDRVSWSIGLGVVGVVTLAVSAVSTTQGGQRALPLGQVGKQLRGAGWYAACAMVLVVALLISVHATNRSERAPLALSVQRASGTTATIVVTSSRDAGPYAIVIDAGAGAGAATVRSDFVLTGGTPVEKTLTIPAGKRVTVRLTDATSGATVRSVILDPR
jgi:hypothetical protein